jgi:DNA-binding MarR family transcriptional regulator
MSKSPCYCHTLRKAARRISARYDSALAPMGISLAQYSMLRTISRHGTLSLTALGDMMELDRSTVGRNVRPLMRDGLLAPGTTDDLRESAVMVTEKGKRVLDAAFPAWSQAQSAIEEALGRKKLGRLIEALEEL